jgi:hypothetical protein
MIYAYKRGTGIGRLAKELNLSICWPYEDRLRVRKHEVHLNWGCSRLTIDVVSTLNRDLSVAASKARTFAALSAAGIRIPRWSDKIEEAQELLKKHTILARRDGLSKGAGITVVKPGGALPTKDFYVRKLSYQREARIHVFRGSIICEQVKYVPEGCKNFIHNFENGCTFSTKTPLEKFFSEAQASEARDFAVRTTQATGLDFGAVDILLNKKGQVYVLEVNTAPGIRSDATHEAYRKALQTLVKEAHE